MEPEDLLEDIVNNALDDAMTRKHKQRKFKMWEFLVENNYKKRDVTEFLHSGTCANLTCTVTDLDILIEGGHSDVREAYPSLGKQEARKIRDYLYGILQDAWQYEKDKSKRKTRIRSK